jgi:hypothetical protein
MEVVDELLYRKTKYPKAFCSREILFYLNFKPTENNKFTKTLPYLKKN